MSMTAESIPDKQSVFRMTLLFLMLGLLLKILWMQFAPVHWDTNYYLNIGSNFVERGELTPYMWRLGADTTIIAGSGTGYGILLLDYWFEVVGLSLYSGYIFMYIFGVLSLVVLYFLARDWWEDEMAGVGAVVFVALTAFFIELYYIRMDAPAVLAYSLILWLHLYAVRSGQNRLHFAVGVALIVTAEIHILVLLYIAALSLYYFIQHIQAIRQQRKIWQITPAIYYFGGLLLAGIIYLLIHVAPDPEAYLVIARECPLCTPAGPLKELNRYMMLLSLRGVETLLFVIMLTAAFLRRTKADKHFTTLVIGYLIALAVISPPIVVQYTAHLLPLIAVGAGGVFAKGYDAKGTLNTQRFKIGMAVASYLFVSQFFTIALISASPPEDPSGVDYVHEFVPEDTVVMGLPSLFEPLLEYDRFLSYRSGERYGILLRDEDYPTFWEREQPQVFVGEPESDDDEWWGYMNAHDFQRVRDEVWIAPDLLETLMAGHPAPELTFFAAQTTLDYGDCVTLEWAVLNTDTVELGDDPVEPVGTQEVCPPITTDYELSAYWVGGVQTETITIKVE